MSVVVAHQDDAATRITLKQAAEQAKFRGTTLEVIHVPESVDVDLIHDQNRQLKREIGDVFKDLGLGKIDWQLVLAPGVEVAETILERIEDRDDVDLLVVGARRRSAVGKLLMGSVTQTLILRAEVPVLVVKAEL